MDMIPDSEVQLDQPIASQQPTASAIPDDAVQLDSDKFSTPGQQAIAGLEGAAQGVAGPLATYAETKWLGVNPEDINARQEANPITHGLAEAAGLGGSLLTGVGEAGLIAKGAEHFIPEGASLATKIGSSALRGAIETGLIQGGNEISDAMLGKGDPTTPVSSALWHMGAASLLGGGIGGAFGTASAGLKALADTKAGSKASQFLEDFGNRWKFNQENPDVADAITSELHEFHGSTKAAADEVYGPTGLKAQAIQKLVPPMNDAIASQNQNISDLLQNKMKEMISDPETYPSRLTKKLQSDMNEWMEVATNPNASSVDSFNATQDLKQRLQAYSKFDKSVGPLSPEKDFIGVAKELQHELRTSLEDSKVWGAAGELQQGVNKSFSDFLPSLKDFERRFTTKIGDESVIDPGKIKTYANQVGKPNAEIKQSMLQNYVDAAEKYRDKISNLHEKLGVESPIRPFSLNAVKSTLGESQSPGAEIADHLFHSGVPGFAARTTAGITGADIGYKEGGVKGAIAGGITGIFAPKIAQIVGRNITRSAIPAALRVLSSGNVKGLTQAIDYAAQADSGAQKITKGLDYLFKAGAAQPAHSYATELNREKLRKFVENGELNNQIQQQVNKPSSINPQPKPPGFAHGGEVKSQFSQPPTSTVAPVLDGTGAIADHFPTQNILLQAAKGRISNYLNSQRPLQNIAKLPFDHVVKDKNKERSYDRLLDLANQPALIFNHIKDGTLTSEQTQHFTQLYPELYDHLNKKMTERISHAQANGEVPPYKIRQTMSLFLNAPLDSSMTPASAQAVQAMFMKQKASAQQAPAPNKNKKGTSNLTKVSNNYMTGNQAREARQDNA